MPFQFRKEAIEEDLNTNFPSQGQGNPPLYYSLSEVVVPTYSINQVAEGSTLSENLQTALDFSVGSVQVRNTITDLVTTTGFWRVYGSIWASDINAVTRSGFIRLTDATPTTKNLYGISTAGNGNNENVAVTFDFVIFVNTGHKIDAVSDNNGIVVDVAYRQIADINGNLTNPLGFSAA